MTAVFASRTNFKSFIESVDQPEDFKLVTDNIVHDFSAISVDAVVFIDEYWKCYPNLVKTYTQVMTYIRGSRSREALQLIKSLIQVENQILQYRQKLILESININSKNEKIHSL